MNIRERDILRSLWKEPYENQRILAEKSGFSLGAVNRCLKNLRENGYLDGTLRLTEKSNREILAGKPL